MNDPNKRIDVNISSLLSLKAELLRKQEEVNRAKLKQSAETFIPKKVTKPDHKENVESVGKESKNYEEYEDSALLEKSKKVLEAKSRFYDKMIASGGKLNSDDNTLVLFNQKKQDTKPYADSSSESEISDDENATGKYKSKHTDEDWVEYTDCLGRTRQCLKKDLEFFKKKDSQLAENIQPRIELNQNAPMWMIDTTPDKPITESVVADDATELTSMISKHDQQKMNWEKKEEENIYKENVHYQDVLFDEARSHGVGYYAFSTDDEERAKQMKALDETREKTLEQQRQREAQRLVREKIIAERVNAAKNRQRARLGLPPIEVISETEPETEKQLYDTKDEEKRKKREEKQKRKKEKEDKKREEERKKHIRPWDKHKPGVPPTNDSTDSDSDAEWTYKPEREPMSQEQWNAMKRDERNPEFAPMPGPPPPPPPLRQFRSDPHHLPDPNEIGPNPLYFTTKKSLDRKNTSREFTKRNYSKSMEDEYREDILGDSEVEYERKSSKGAEIPPPATFEYYGPSSAKREKVIRPDLEQSIEAGLKFLRNQSDKGVLPSKSSWTAKADY